jgi:hypothetical protein
MRKNNQGSEFDQSPVYVCIKISQWNSFVQVKYAKEKGDVLWALLANIIFQCLFSLQEWKAGTLVDNCLF